MPANFWPTFGTVHSQDVLVHCTGNETSLRECIGDGDGSGASSFLPVGEVTCNSHAGVICEGTYLRTGISHLDTRNTDYYIHTTVQLIHSYTSGGS